MGRLCPRIARWDIQANLACTIAIEQMDKVLANVDVVVAPTSSAQLLASNFTGYPALILPNGFRGEDAPKPHVSEDGEVGPGGPGTPVSMTFLGNLYSEAKLLAVAKAYQDGTGFHLKHPPLPAL